MFFWRRKPKRVKLKYKIESIHLDEYIDSKRYWIVNYMSSSVGSAYEFILKNKHLGKDIDVNLIAMNDSEHMVIQFEGCKKDIEDYINLLIEKDINFLRWYKITLD